MKFRLIEDKLQYGGEYLLKLWKEYINYLVSLSESQLIDELQASKGTIQAKCPLFVTPNGTILNAQNVNSDYNSMVHLDIFVTAFIKKHDLEMSNWDELMRNLTDRQYGKFMDRGNKFTDYAMYALGWLKLNTGTEISNGSANIILPLSLSYSQHAILKDFLYYLVEYHKDAVQVMDADGNTVIYNFNESDPEYIMDRIDAYYRAGKLLEVKNKLREADDEDFKHNGRTFIRLWKEYLSYLSSLRDEQLISALSDAVVDEMKMGTAMFITSNGTILDASVVSTAKDFIQHTDILLKPFLAKHGLTVEEFFEKLTSLQVDKFFDTAFSIQDIFETKQNWLRLNSGTVLDDGNPYIELPYNLSYSQRDLLRDYFFMLIKAGKKKVTVSTVITDYRADYEFKEVDVDYIMDRIDTYYRTGKLLENKSKRITK